MYSVYTRTICATKLPNRQASEVYFPENMKPNCLRPTSVNHFRKHRGSPCVDAEDGHCEDPLKDFIKRRHRVQGRGGLERTGIQYFNHNLFAKQQKN